MNISLQLELFPGVDGPVGGVYTSAHTPTEAPPMFAPLISEYTDAELVREIDRLGTTLTRTQDFDSPEDYDEAANYYADLVIEREERLRRQTGLRQGAA